MAAEKVFIEKGFSNTTMTDIVTASGLSRGGLYHYFSNTDEVYQALLTERDSEAFEYFQKLESDYDTVWDAIESYLSSLAEAMNDVGDILAPVNIEYFIIGRHEQGRKDFINARYDQGKMYFVNLFNKGVKSGELKPIQPLPTIANFLMNAADSMHVQILIMNSEKADIKGQIQALRIYLKQALGHTQN